MLEAGLAIATSRKLITPELAGPLAQLLVVLLVGYGLWQNPHLRSLWFVALGFICNGLVIIANGGHMPVSGLALYRVGLGEALASLVAKTDAVHGLMDASTRLWYLGDVLPVRLWGYSNVISLGDVYLMAGIVLVILDAALEARARREQEFQIDLEF